ncbi:hypothetical protein ACTHO0_26675 [Cytobacillus praedii]|uniref:hypothetical protein n=1 Tax=Cytobacillus praedii TaxID=1742358 RepID=UPI003F821CB8
MEVIFGLALLLFIFYIWDSFEKIKKNQELIIKHLGIDPSSSKKSKIKKDDKK